MPRKAKSLEPATAAATVKGYEVIIQWRRESDPPTLKRTAEMDFGTAPKSTYHAAFLAGREWDRQPGRDARLIQGVRVLVTDSVATSAVSEEVQELRDGQS